MTEATKSTQQGVEIYAELPYTAFSTRHRRLSSGRRGATALASRIGSVCYSPLSPVPSLSVGSLQPGRACGRPHGRGETADGREPDRQRARPRGSCSRMKYWPRFLESKMTSPRSTNSGTRCLKSALRWSTSRQLPMALRRRCVQQFTRLRANSHTSDDDQCGHCAAGAGRHAR